MTPAPALRALAPLAAAAADPPACLLAVRVHWLASAQAVAHAPEPLVQASTSCRPRAETAPCHKQHLRSQCKPLNRWQAPPPAAAPRTAAPATAGRRRRQAGKGLVPASEIKPCSSFHVRSHSARACWVGAAAVRGAALPLAGSATPSPAKTSPPRSSLPLPCAVLVAVGAVTFIAYVCVVGCAGKLRRPRDEPPPPPFSPRPCDPSTHGSSAAAEGGPLRLSQTLYPVDCPALCPVDCPCAHLFACVCCCLAHPGCPPAPACPRRDL